MIHFQNASEKEKIKKKPPPKEQISKNIKKKKKRKRKSETQLCVRIQLFKYRSALPMHIISYLLC